jgi:16S rRNA (cytidine1402-2'-O)-methyltransferase
MPGILYVVATPIGNLEDVTFRALRILREVSLVAAEDTRRTAKLLQHYSIPTPTTSLHEHNERARTPALIRRLKDGESIALVSDAGTPVLSDPGRLLIAAAHAAGIRVEPIPGPSAAMATVSAAGLPADEVLFVGFPPARASARKRWLQRLAAEPRLLVLYEAPHRIHDTLHDIASILGERTVAVGRELTKTHEQLGVRPISAWLDDLPPAKGEFTLAVGGTSSQIGVADEVPSSASLVTDFGELTNNGVLGRREAVKKLAERYGLSANDVYRKLEDAKK